jgi:hypothetical protein
MATIKTGLGVSAISGKAGGAIFARNRAGAYVRNFAKPVNRRTSLQQTIRGAIASAVSKWNAVLTSTQRAGWDTYAGNITKFNRLGDAIHNTGFNFFCGSASILQQIGGAVVVAPPTSLYLPEIDPGIVATLTASTHTVSMAYTTGLAYLSEAGGYMAIYMGRPVSATKNQFSGPYRYLDKVSGAVSPPAGPKVMTTLPYTLVAGQKVWFKCRIVRADGRVSTSFFCSAISG